MCLILATSEAKTATHWTPKKLKENIKSTFWSTAVAGVSRRFKRVSPSFLGSEDANSADEDVCPPVRPAHYARLQNTREPGGQHLTTPTPAQLLRF